MKRFAPTEKLVSKNFPKEKFEIFENLYFYDIDRFSETVFVQGYPVLKYPVRPGRFVFIFRYFSFWKYARL